jgi:hypothetical protein
MIKSLNLSIVLEKKTADASLKLFEFQEEVDEKNCNFVCILLGKVCKDMSFSKIVPMISKNFYT